jgi:hypothetical protein
MFARKPRAPDDGEIISPVEIFTWEEDGSVTERRRRRLWKKQIWTTCVGATLALLVLGHAFGISWLVSAVASGETTSAQMK